MNSLNFNFHMEIRNSSKHELICLIEKYNRYIKSINKKEINITTLEDFYIQERKCKRDELLN